MDGIAKAMANSEVAMPLLDGLLIARTDGRTYERITTLEQTAFEPYTPNRVDNRYLVAPKSYKTMQSDRDFTQFLKSRERWKVMKEKLALDQQTVERRRAEAVAELWLTAEPGHLPASLRPIVKPKPPKQVEYTFTPTQMAIALAAHDSRSRKGSH